MRTHTRRALLVVALLPALIAPVYGVREYRHHQEVARYYDEAYDRIEVGMPSPNVSRLLRSEGTEIAPRGWPQTLGEVPRYAKGIPFEVAAGEPVAKRFQATVSPKTKVWWSLWEVPGSHRWIAVAFFSDGSGGSLTIPTAIMKRSGRNEELSHSVSR